MSEEPLGMSVLKHTKSWRRGMSQLVGEGSKRPDSRRGVLLRRA
jgi:hypothetical protein